MLARQGVISIFGTPFSPMVYNLVIMFTPNIYQLGHDLGYPRSLRQSQNPWPSSNMACWTNSQIFFSTFKLWDFPATFEQTQGPRLPQPIFQVPNPSITAPWAQHHPLHCHWSEPRTPPGCLLGVPVGAHGEGVKPGTTNFALFVLDPGISWNTLW